MIGGARQKATDRRHALERTLAPHVDVRWADALVVELTRLGAGGTDVVAALSAVEAHCAATGEHPGLAFGEPVAYADSLELAPSGDVLRARRTLLGLRLVPVVIGVAGTLLAVMGAASLREGLDAVVTNGFLVSAGLFVLAIVALVRFSTTVLRASGSNPALVVLGTVVLGGGVVLVPALLLDEPVVALDALVTTVVGGMLVIAGGTAGLVHRQNTHPGGPILPALALPVASALLVLVVLAG